MNPRRSRSRSPRGPGGESTPPSPRWRPARAPAAGLASEGTPTVTSPRSCSSAPAPSSTTCRTCTGSSAWHRSFLVPNLACSPGRTRNCQGHSELPHALSGLGHEPDRRWPVRVPGPPGDLDRRGHQPDGNHRAPRPQTPPAPTAADMGDFLERCRQGLRVPRSPYTFTNTYSAPDAGLWR